MKRLMNFRTRRRVLTYMVVIFFGSYILTLISRLMCTEVYRNTQKRVSRYLNIADDVSCYRPRRYNNSNEMHLIKSNVLYMIIASCSNSLSANQACAIEAVLQVHAYEKHVYVLHTREIKYCLCSKALMNGFKDLYQVDFIEIQIDKFVEDTPFKNIFRGDFLNIGLDRQARVVEYLKLAALYKFKGIVIDLDTILAKPLYYLGMNWGVRINDSHLGTAAIALDVNTPIGDSLLKKSMELMIEQKRNEKIDSGLALTMAYRQLCHNNTDAGCSSFKMYDAELFYPFNRTSSNKMFEVGDLLPKSYGYYIWDTTETYFRNGSVYAKLMRENCPNVADYLKI